MLKKVTEIILIIDLILGLILIPVAKLDIPTLIFILIVSLITPPLSILIVKLEWRFITYINKAELFPINKIKLIFAASLLFLVLPTLYFFKQDQNIAIRSLIFAFYPLYLFLIIRKSSIP